ncbi:MAG TPA: hypothetical protein V6D33_02435 [Cyanophyceae cyanobacterium]
MAQFLNPRFFIFLNSYKVIQVCRFQYTWRTQERRFCSFQERLAAIVGFLAVNYFVTHFSLALLHPKTDLSIPQGGGLDGRF